MERARTPMLGASGFSLVEVMVAVVVICIGLLGIAKMQAMAVSTTNMSRQRSLAAIEAASIAASMHSNREYWAQFSTPFWINITSGAGAVPVVTSTDPALLAQTVTNLAVPPPLKSCVGTNNGIAVCSPAGAGTNASLAAFDVARWYETLAGLLPTPVTALINCPGAVAGNPAPTSCTVQITWLEKAVAINSTEALQEQTAGPSTSEKPVFTLYVEP
jgi:type IV pilus assembly protein PilV